VLAAGVRSAKVVARVFRVGFQRHAPAGLSGARADQLRRAMGAKRSPERMEALKGDLMAGMEELGIEPGHEWIVLSDPAFLSSLRTTILFVLLVVPIQIILGLILANLLTKGVRGTVVYRTLIVIPWIAPPLALGVVWSWIFAPTGGLLSALAGTRLEILVSPTWALPAAAFVVVWSKLVLWARSCGSFAHSFIGFVDIEAP